MAGKTIAKAYLHVHDPVDAEITEVTDGNPLPVRDSTTTDIVALMQGPLRYASSVTITCAAAGDYAAGDVWSASASNNVGAATYVGNLARIEGSTIAIAAIRAVSSNASLLNRMRLQWFARNPLAANVEMDDNAVFAFTTAIGRQDWVGSTLTAPFTTKGTSDTVALQEPLQPIAGEKGLYLVLTTEDAEVNEAASQTVRLDFYTL